MRILHYWPTLLLCTAGATATAQQGFAPPSFSSDAHNACTAANVTTVLAPDNSAISLLRREGDFVRTKLGSKSSVKARCRFNLVVNKPSGDHGILQIDLRGGDDKLPLSELELKITFGSSQHHAVYPRGQVLSDSANFRRFKLTNLPAGPSKVRVDIEARARSLDGKDTILLSFDSFDACFVDQDANEGCAKLVPPQNPTPAVKP